MGFIYNQCVTLIEWNSYSDVNVSHVTISAHIFHGHSQPPQITKSHCNGDKCASNEVRKAHTRNDRLMIREMRLSVFQECIWCCIHAQDAVKTNN